MAAAARVERLILDDTPPAITIAALVADWRAAQAQAEAEEKRLGIAQAEAAALYSPDPPGGRYGAALFSRELAAQDFWWRQTEAIDVAFGIPAIEAAANQAWEAANTIARRILSLRPTTVQEAALKYAVVLAEVRDDQGKIENPAPLAAFLDDIEQLAKLSAGG